MCSGGATGSVAPCADRGGFTIVEVIVSVGILTMILGLVGSGVFQSLSTQRSWQDDVTATRELRHAGSWFAGDALNAEGTDLVDGAQPVPSATLTWTDALGSNHAAAYTLSGSDLVRDYDGVQQTVARRVSSIDISLSGKMVTFELEVAAEDGGTDISTLQTYLRMLR